MIGKCRVGHRHDILVVESSSQFIVSGGVDGLLSIWNLFSGTLKFAVELPPPRLAPEIKDFNFNEDESMSSDVNSSHSSLESNELSDLEDSQSFSN